VRQCPYCKVHNITHSQKRVIKCFFSRVWTLVELKMLWLSLKTWQNCPHIYIPTPLGALYATTPLRVGMLSHCWFLLLYRPIRYFMQWNNRLHSCIVLMGSFAGWTIRNSAPKQ
jgi:hypothetical protein